MSLCSYLLDEWVFSKIWKQVGNDFESSGRNESSKEKDLIWIKISFSVMILSLRYNDVRKSVGHLTTRMYV